MQYFGNWHQAVNTLGETKWSVIDIQFDWWCGRWKSLRFVAHEFNNDLHKCHESPWIVSLSLTSWTCRQSCIYPVLFWKRFTQLQVLALELRTLPPAKCRYWYILSSKQLIRPKFNCEVVSFSSKLIIVVDKRNECYLLLRYNWHKSGLKSAERKRHKTSVGFTKKTAKLIAIFFVFGLHNTRAALILKYIK